MASWRASTGESRSRAHAPHFISALIVFSPRLLSFMPSEVSYLHPGSLAFRDQFSSLTPSPLIPGKSVLGALWGQGVGVISCRHTVIIITGVWRGGTQHRECLCYAPQQLLPTTARQPRPTPPLPSSSCPYEMEVAAGFITNRNILHHKLKIHTQNT